VALALAVAAHAIPFYIALYRQGYSGAFGVERVPWNLIRVEPA
jgi:hypothetical protein